MNALAAVFHGGKSSCSAVQWLKNLKSQDAQLDLREFKMSWFDMVCLFKLNGGRVEPVLAEMEFNNENPIGRIWARELRHSVSNDMLDEFPAVDMPEFLAFGIKHFKNLHNLGVITTSKLFYFGAIIPPMVPVIDGKARGGPVITLVRPFWNWSAKTIVLYR